MQDAIKHHTMAPEKICKVSPLYLIEVLATFFAFNNIPRNFRNIVPAALWRHVLQKSTHPMTSSFRKSFT